ncbi:MAG: sialidase family protein [Pedobacter sp.]|jgi:sialidase-1|uniref:sialidase family protein n=1 Tax=Pedobacter sp. TaxID=1411316 RepID=UPI003567DDF6
MRTTLNTLIFLLLSIASIAQVKYIPVFVSGQEGHQSYRIPAIVTLKNGDLLAFAEGRVNNAGDFGDINIVLKRSTNKGKTWSALQTVVDYDKFQAGNPAPVVDFTDPKYPKGRIFLFYNTGNNHESEVRKGNGLREVWYKTSMDGGLNWSEAVNITTQVHKPKIPQLNPKYNFAEDWRSYANTPGHAMQFDSGTYKGRIFVSANHSASTPQSGSKDYQAHGYYTDDHGATFKLSENVSFLGGNEAMAAQLSGDEMVMNIRNQQGNVKQRIIAISKNGGQTWDKTFFDSNLPDPVCQGSTLSYLDKKGNRVLFVCNAADVKKRDNLTLRMSNNYGKSWEKSLVIAKSPDGYKGSSYSAYSDIVKLSKNKIGVLFEKDEYKSIVFVAQKW